MTHRFNAVAAIRRICGAMATHLHKSKKGKRIARIRWPLPCRSVRFLGGPSFQNRKSRARKEAAISSRPGLLGLERLHG